MTKIEAIELLLHHERDLDPESVKEYLCNAKLTVFDLAKDFEAAKVLFNRQNDICKMLTPKEIAEILSIHSGSIYKENGEKEENRQNCYNACFKYLQAANCSIFTLLNDLNARAIITNNKQLEGWLQRDPTYKNILDCKARGINLYQILGLSPNASTEEINKKYKKLAFDFHPDKNPDNKAAQEKFQEINTAHEILKDPEARRYYDEIMGFSTAKPAQRPQPASYQ